MTLVGLLGLDNLGERFADHFNEDISHLASFKRLQRYTDSKGTYDLTGCTFRYIVAFLDDADAKEMTRAETHFDWVTSLEDLGRIKLRGISGLEYARILVNQKTISKTVAMCLADKVEPQGSESDEKEIAESASKLSEQVPTVSRS